MDLLLHCCCGPCAAGSLPFFLAEGYTPYGWFFNPNIHPFTENKERRKSFNLFMEQEGIPHSAEKDYPLEQWLSAVAQAPEQRCTYCYQSRLDAAAQKAAEMGLPYFSTTLLVSPYQNHELIRMIGEECGHKHGVTFAYVDPRPGFRDGQALARERGLYMQKYCGCIYSEKERYVRTKRSVQA